MILKLSRLMHTGMDLELLNCINVDMKWNILKKGRTSMTRRPRKPGADGLELVYNIQEPAAFESKKSGTLKVAGAPSKKRRLLHQSTSTPPQTPCINSEEGLSPGPQTPSVHHEVTGQRCWSNSLSKSQKTKSKTRLRNIKMKQTKKVVLNLDDFSGIQLLADVACNSFIHENSDHVEDFSISKEHTAAEVNLCGADVKDAIVSPGSNGSAIQQKVNDNGNEVEEKNVAPSQGLRLHWDLNTVMEEWQDPCDDLLIESVKHDDASISVVPLIENCNVDTSEETYELGGTKTVAVKTPDGESSASKSEVVDSLAHAAKCEDFSTSTTSLLKEQFVASCESDAPDGPKLDQQPVSEEVIQGFCDNKVATEDHVSECCCSNVTQEEQGLSAEGDSEDKIQAGYDSPFEDGELREPIEKPEKETICKDSDNVYKDDFGIIENPLSVKADHGQTVDGHHSLLVKKALPKNEIEQGVQVDAFERPHIDESRKGICENKRDEVSRLVQGRLLHIDESTSFEVCRSGEYIHRSRSSTIGDSFTRVCDLKSHRSVDRNYSRNYNSRGGGGYRTQDRRPSSSERNNSYGSYREPPPARSHTGDRYRYRSQEYHDPKPYYSETKPHFNRPGTRSRSRSRSGSPIAWHFQKRKNMDTSNSGEIKTGSRGGHVSSERSSKCFDDHHRFRDGPLRQAHPTLIQQKQRYDSIGYPERLKPDDYIRLDHRAARFSQMKGYNYKDKSDDIRKHDGYYEKVNHVGRSVDDGVRRLRYGRE